MRRLILWAALAIPSFAVVAKFSGVVGVVLYSVCVGIALVFAPGLIGRMPGRYVAAMSVVTLLAVVILFAAVYPRVNVHSPGMGSDDDDAHNVGVAALFDGESPYSRRTYLGNALHQLPGAYVLAAPFVALGTSALQNLVCIPLFFLLVARRTGDSRIALVLAWIVLSLSPSVLHQIVTGSSYSWNAIWVVLAIWCLWQRPSGWLAPIFCGVAMCSRPNFLLLLPPICGALAHSHGRHIATRAIGITFLTALVLFLPFYADGPDFGPVEAFSTLDQFDDAVPGAGVAILLGTAILAIGLSLKRVNLDGLLLQCALVQAMPVSAVLALSAAVEDGNRWITLTSYATFASWFVLLAHPLGADVSARPVLLAETFDPHHPPFARGVNELIPADHDADMRRAGRNGGEEDQVARLEVIALDVLADPELIPHLARHRDSVLTVDVTDKAAAVEA